MRLFKVLLVDDDRTWAEIFQQNLRKIPLAHLAGKEYQGLEVTHANSQEDADQKVLAAEPDGYDLVLLDLRYPKVSEGPIGEEFQGMDWLPELRRLQPNATIIVLTSFAGQSHLQHAISAIRDHGANDFIPKTAPINQIVARIQLARENARRLNQILLLEKEYHALLRTRALRTFAEDIGILIKDANMSLRNVANRLESGDPSIIATAAETIRSQFSHFKKEFDNLTSRVNEGPDRCRQVDVVALVRQMLMLYDRMIRSVQATAYSPDASQSVRVNTYENDLKLALHEVITNAIDSLKNTRTPAEERELAVTVERDGENVVIRVTDNGDGFSAEAMQHLFEHGYTSKNEPYQGLGLYTAKRMMNHIGGTIEPVNREEGGAEVTLTLQDLGRS